LLCHSFDQRDSCYLSGIFDAPNLDLSDGLAYITAVIRGGHVIEVTLWKSRTKVELLRGMALDLALVFESEMPLGVQTIHRIPAVAFRRAAIAGLRQPE
jgi:hypothetical protein